MIERLMLRILKSFIYVFSMRLVYLGDLAYHYSFDMFLYYISLAIILSLIIEMFNYLISDYVKYTPIIISVIIGLSIYIYAYHITHFYFTMLLYLDFVIIKNLAVSYEMYKNLNKFKINSSID